MVESENPVETGFRKALDQNGYSFQYAVLELIQDAAGHGVPWRPVAPEFGVEVRGRDTRVDFILQHRSERMYMVASASGRTQLPPIGALHGLLGHTAVAMGP